ncbi:MAG TPA: heavy-metal-associated domain-containing protein [Kiritimatiellia bacterium]|nr:heavy-metal-associated domain-containing protein [Kiritimatiellia bacterium]
MKITLIALTLMVSLTFLSTGCFRNDTRTVAFHIPHLNAPECAEAVRIALGAMDGIYGAEADIPNRTLTVTFDGLKLGIKNIEFTIAGAGFDVEDTQGNPRAKAALPAPCREP